MNFWHDINGDFQWASIAVLVSFIAAIISFLSAYMSLNFSRKKLMDEKERENFSMNKLYYREYLNFLLEVISCYKNNIYNAMYDLSDGTVLEHLTIDDVRATPKCIKGNYERRFTGLSQTDIKNLKANIKELSDNFFVLQFDEFFFKKELEMYNQIEGRQFIGEWGFDEEESIMSDSEVNEACFFDSDREIFEFAVQEITRVQALINKFTNLKLKILN